MRVLFIFSAFAVIGCSSDPAANPNPVPPPAADAGVDAPIDDEAPPPPVDGKYAYGPAGIRSDRFVTRVVSFTAGPGAGFGSARFPQTVYGPPVGGGDDSGGLDVLSLGTGGEIVLSFEPNAIVDGPGPDFLVFENAFLVAGDANDPVAELGEVSVSEDGASWKTFACTRAEYPYGDCAGWHPVYSSPQNALSPIDPAVAGGDPFDLATLGVTKARFVKIVDKTTKASGPVATGKYGFDLDAVAIVNAQLP